MSLKEIIECNFALFGFRNFLGIRTRHSENHFKWFNYLQIFERVKLFQVQFRNAFKNDVFKITETQYLRVGMVCSNLNNLEWTTCFLALMMLDFVTIFPLSSEEQALNAILDPPKKKLELQLSTAKKENHLL